MTMLKELDRICSLAAAALVGFLLGALFFVGARMADELGGEVWG